MGTDGQRDGNAERLHCLVTGASGYIGGRLVPELLRAGHRVRCLARTPASSVTIPGRGTPRRCGAT